MDGWMSTDGGMEFDVNDFGVADMTAAAKKVGLTGSFG